PEAHSPRGKRLLGPGVASFLQQERAAEQPAVVGGEMLEGVGGSEEASCDQGFDPPPFPGLEPPQILGPDHLLGQEVALLGELRDIGPEELGVTLAKADLVELSARVAEPQPARGLAGCNPGIEPERSS